MVEKIIAVLYCVFISLTHMSYKTCPFIFLHTPLLVVHFEVHLLQELDVSISDILPWIHILEILSNKMIFCVKNDG